MALIVKCRSRHHRGAKEKNASQAFESLSLIVSPFAIHDAVDFKTEIVIGSSTADVSPILMARAYR